MPGRLRRLLGHRDLLRAGAIWALLATGSLLSVVLVLHGNFPFRAADVARDSDKSIYILLLYASLNFFALAVPILYSVVRWRARDEDGDSPHQARTHWFLPKFWLSYALGVGALAVVFPGATGLLSIWRNFERPPQLVVDVTGKQWGWKFGYPRLGVPASSALVLPVDTRVRFRISTEDVIHSFWVPAFRVKFDAIPGEKRDLYMTTTATGTTSAQPRLRVQCAELCGIGHAEMQAPVMILPRPAFERWVARQRAAAREAMQRAARLRERLRRLQGSGP